LKNVGIAVSRQSPRRLIGLRTTLVAFAVSAALATGSPSHAQRADSNAGLAGGQDRLFDAILATPNRKTPGPQDETVAVPPDARQAVPPSHSKTKAIEVSPGRNRISPREHQ
jgi:hypothetical protein